MRSAKIVNISTSFALNLQSHLRPGLDAARATAILQALCMAEVYHELAGG